MLKKSFLNGAMAQLAKLLPASTGIPYECLFVSWLFHFSFGSLLVDWENRRGWLKALGLCTYREIPCGHLESELSCRIFFSVSPSVNLLFQSKFKFYLLKQSFLMCLGKRINSIF